MVKQRPGLKMERSTDTLIMIIMQCLLAQRPQGHLVLMPWISSRTLVIEQQSLLGRRNQPPTSCKPQEWQFSEAIAAVSWKRFWTPKSQMGCTTYNSSINFTNQLIILNSLVKFQLIPDCDFSINPKYTEYLFVFLFFVDIQGVSKSCLLK